MGVKENHVIVIIDNYQRRVSCIQLAGRSCAATAMQLMRIQTDKRAAAAQRRSSHALHKHPLWPAHNMFTYTEIQRATELHWFALSAPRSLMRPKLLLLQNNWMMDTVVFSVHMELRISFNKTTSQVWDYKTSIETCPKESDGQFTL